MTGAGFLPAAARLLTCAAAAAWPLGLLAQLPFTPLTLGTVFATALCLVAAVMARRHRALRPPFEYWWPAPLAAIWMLSASEESAGARVLAGLAAFLAANVLVRERPEAARAMAVFCGACAVAAIANWMAAWGLAPPAGIDPVRGLAIAGGASIPDQCLLLWCGLLAGIAAAAHPGLHPAARGLAFAALLLPGSWLLAMLPDAGGLFGQASTAGQPGPAWLAVLLPLWLVARVMSRGLLRPADPGATPPWLLPVLIVAGAAPHIALGRIPAPEICLLLGLTAAHDAPWAGDTAVSPPARYQVVIAGVLAFFVGLQVAGIPPLSSADPRNHTAHGELLLREKSWDALDARMDFLLRLDPGNARYAILSARSLLAQGRPAAAVDRFREAFLPPIEDHAGAGAQFIPEQNFLDELRDAVSALPPGSRGLLFERALVHAGQAEEALNSLNIRKDMSAERRDVDAAVLRETTARLLGNPAMAEDLAGWTGAELAALLEGGGIDLTALPSEFPDAGHAVVLRALTTPGGLRIDVLSGGEQSPRRIELGGFTPAVSDGSLQWGAWKWEQDGGLRVSLNGPEGPIGVLLPGPPLRFESARLWLPRGESSAMVIGLP